MKLKENKAEIIFVLNGLDHTRWNSFSERNYHSKKIFLNKICAI